MSWSVGRLRKIRIRSQCTNRALTVSTHGFAQLHGDLVRFELFLVARLDFYSICANDLLDLPTLEAHLGFAHDLGVGSYTPNQHRCITKWKSRIERQHLGTKSTWLDPLYRSEANVRIDSPAQTTNANLTRSEYSSLPTFIRT